MWCGKRYDGRIDTYSLACLLIEMRSGHRAFQYLIQRRRRQLREQQQEQQQQEQQQLGSLEELLSADCPYQYLLTEQELAFCTTCMQPDPGLRPTITELLTSDPYLDVRNMVPATS